MGWGSISYVNYKKLIKSYIRLMSQKFKHLNFKRYISKAENGYGQQNTSLVGSSHKYKLIQTNKKNIRC